MLSLHDNKTSIAVFAGLTLVGSLAGCAASTADAGTGSTTNETATAQNPAASGSPSSPAAAGASGSTYKDGTYTESADYQSPNGTETIDVTLTLAGDVITDVKVVGHGTSPDSQLHQGQFASGISAVVVGKDIDQIKVDKVGGSSLTSQGFNIAVGEIKTDAS